MFLFIVLNSVILDSVKYLCSANLATLLPEVYNTPKHTLVVQLRVIHTNTTSDTISTIPTVASSLKFKAGYATWQ